MTYLVGKHPFIKLRVKLLKNEWINLGCLIDTGFSGGLALPQKYKDYFPKEKFVETHFQLADNSEITVDATFTAVRFGDKQKDVAVAFIGDQDNLVGVEFLDQLT